MTELTGEVLFQWFKQRSPTLRSTFLEALRSKNPDNPVIRLLTEALNVIDMTTDPAALSVIFVNGLRELYRGLTSLKSSHDGKKEAKKISSNNAIQQWITDIYSKIHSLLVIPITEKVIVQAGIDEIIAMIEGVDFNQWLSVSTKEEEGTTGTIPKYVGNSMVTSTAWKGLAIILRANKGNLMSVHTALLSVCLGPYIPMTNNIPWKKRTYVPENDDVLSKKRKLYVGIASHS